jgi:hypothetical protein
MYLICVGIDAIEIAAVDAIEIASVHVLGQTEKWKECKNHTLAFPFFRHQGTSNFALLTYLR